jgi:hypothetical protein
VAQIIARTSAAAISGTCVNATHLGEDVTRARRVSTTHEACTELPRREQQVDVVAAHEVLGHPDDGTHERRLAVVVLRVLRHVAGRANTHTHSSARSPAQYLFDNFANPTNIQPISSCSTPHRDAPCQLRHLDLGLEVALEASEQHLPLRRLESVHESLHPEDTPHMHHTAYSS